MAQHNLNYFTSLYKSSTLTSEFDTTPMKQLTLLFLLPLFFLLGFFSSAAAQCNTHISEWINMNGIEYNSESGNLVGRVNGFAALGTAVSQEFLASGANGSLDFSIESPASSYLYRLGFVTNSSDTEVAYGFERTNGDSHPLRIIENGEVKASYTGISVGSKLSIRRRDGVIHYYKDGVLLRKSLVPSNTILHVLGHSGYSTYKVPRLYLNACNTQIISHPTGCTNLGSVSILGYSSGRYVLSNSEGITVGSADISSSNISINNLQIGIYTLDITSGSETVSSRISIESGSSIHWENMNGIEYNSESGNLVGRANGFAALGTAVSQEFLASGANGSLDFSIESPASSYLYRLGFVTNSSDTEVAYGFERTNGDSHPLRIIENGEVKASYTGISVGSKLSIRRRDGVIHYYKDGVLLRKSLVPSNTILHVLGHSGYSTYKVPRLYLNACNTQIISHPTGCTNLGSVSILGYSSGRYVLSNSEGITVGSADISSSNISINNLQIGIYTLDITSGSETVSSRISIESGSSIHWENMNGIEYNSESGNLVGRANGFAALGTAVSQEFLASGANGSLDFSIESPASSYLYRLGFVTNSSDTEVAYGFERTNGDSHPLRIIENGEVKASYTGISVGSKLSIRRRDGVIHYYKDGVLLRKSLVPSNTILHVLGHSGYSTYKVPRLYLNACNTQIISHPTGCTNLGSVSILGYSSGRYVLSNSEGITVGSADISSSNISINNLQIGIYTLDITSGSETVSSRISIESGLSIHWENMNGIEYNSESGNLVGRANGFAALGTAVSQEFLASGANGSLDFSIESPASSYLYRLGFVTNSSDTEVAYGFERTNGDSHPLRIIENGEVKASYTGISVGSKLSIRRRDGVIHYYKDGVLLRKSLVPSNTILHVLGHSGYSTYKVPRLYLNACNTQIISHPTGCTNLGSVSILGYSSGRYVLSNSEGITVGSADISSSNISINNLQIGIYTLDITSGSETVSSRISIESGSSIHWENMNGIEYNSESGNLVGRANGFAALGTAVSQEFLASGANGSLDFSIESPASSYLYRLGFVTNSSDTEVAYGFERTNGDSHPLRIIENGEVIPLNPTVIPTIGTKLSIRRINGTIYYYRDDDILLYTSLVSSTTKLYVLGHSGYSTYKVPRLYLNECSNEDDTEDPCTPAALSETTDWSYSSSDVSMNTDGRLESSLKRAYTSALGNSAISSDGKLSFTVDNTDFYYTVGFTSETVLPVSQMSNSEAENFMDYGFYVWKNTLKIYEQGHTYTFDGILQVGTQLSVERRGNKIQYRRDNLLIWESNVDANISLHSYSAVFREAHMLPTVIPVINFSPCPTYDIVTTYDVTIDFCESTQSLTLNTLPIGFYEYEWTSLETGSTANGTITGNSVSLSEGRYRITTKFGGTIVDETIVTLDLNNLWVTNAAIEYDPITDQLISTPNNVYYAWVSSEEEVTSSDLRRLSVTLDDPLKHNYMLGFTAEIPNNLPITVGDNTILNTMDYGWYAWTDGLAIYENGRKYTFPYEAGVKLSIERIGTKILYRKDGLLVYQSDMETNSNYSNATNTILHPHSIIWKGDDGLGRMPTIEYSCISELDNDIATIETSSNSCTGTEVSVSPTFTSGDYTYEYTYLDVVPNLVVDPTGDPAAFIPPFDGKYNVKVTSTSNGVQEFVIDIIRINWEEPSSPSNYDVKWALGTESLPIGKNGSISFTIDKCETRLFYQVGLSSTGYSTGDPDNSMEYGWYVWENVLKIYELGNATPVGFIDNNCEVGTHLSVEKVNNTIRYYKNGELIHTTNGVDVTLYPHYIQWYGYDLPPISFTSCEITTCDASPLLSISERVGYDYEWYYALDRTTRLGVGTEYTPDPLSNGEHVFTIVGTNTATSSQYIITQTVIIEADVELLALTASPTAVSGEQFDIEGILGVNRDLENIDRIEWFVDGTQIDNNNDYEISTDFLTLTVLSFDAEHTYLLKLISSEGCEITLEKTITLRDDECTSSTPIPILGLDLSKNYSFLELNNNLSASYYSTNQEGLLNFKYTERYKEGDLSVDIYNWERCKIGQVELTKKIGTNWYSLDLNEVCNESEYYVMEVFDENNRRKVLNFKYGFDDMKAVLVGDGWYCPNETLNYKVAIENGHADYVVELWGKRNASTEWILLDVQSTANNDLTGSVANTSVNFPIQFTNMRGDAVLKAIVIDDWGNEVETSEVGIEERPECSQNERMIPTAKKGYKINVRFSIRNLLPKIQNIFKTR